MSEKNAIHRREVDEIIKRLQEKQNLTIQDIAHKLRVSISSVSNWKRGIFLPRREEWERLKALAEGKQTDTYPPNSPIPLASAETVRLSVFESLPAGPPQDAQQERVDEWDVPIMLLGGNWPDAYVVRLRGDSAEPKAFDGDWVIVRHGKEARPGDIVVAKIDEEWTVKRLCKDGKSLEAINPKYEKMKPKQELQIVGVVIRFHTDPKNEKRVRQLRGEA